MYTKEDFILQKRFNNIFKHHKIEYMSMFK